MRCHRPVHVAVEDQHPMHPPGLEQVTADHRQVVEDAKPCRVVVVGMMGATRQVAGDAIAQGHFGGQQRAAHGPYRTPGQRLAQGRPKRRWSSRDSSPCM